MESAPGAGSAFHFTVQFRLSSPQRLAQRPRSTLPLRGLPTLVVDDNSTNRRVLYEILSHWQMRPTAVDGALAALTELEKAVALGTPFPLVLLDAQMPDVDGFTLAERIKQTPELAGATIMMLSSADLPGDTARCRALGIAVHLVKPIKQSELLDALLGVISPDAVAAPRVDRRPDRCPAVALRILLAEDNIVNQKVMVRMLEKMGHHAVIAVTGTQALAALERESFDMVLMDVQMPDMDGLEAAAVIRARENGTSRHLPIVALTAHAMKGDEERCMLAGMDAYVSKPVASEKLVTIIGRLFAGDADNRRASPGTWTGTRHR